MFLLYWTVVTMTVTRTTATKIMKTKQKAKKKILLSVPEGELIASCFLY